MFTREQINEIKHKLQLEGIKDTQFPFCDSINNVDSIPIIQNYKNKRITIQQLLQYLKDKNIGTSTSTVVTDTEMSDTSTNPVQNKVIKAYIDSIIEDVNVNSGDISKLEQKTDTLSDSIDSLDEFITDSVNRIDEDNSKLRDDIEKQIIQLNSKVVQAEEVYNLILSTQSNTITSTKYNELVTAISQHKIINIILDDVSIISESSGVINGTVSLFYHYYNNTDISIDYVTIIISSDYTVDLLFGSTSIPVLQTDGNGTKFLSDDGTYKTVDLSLFKLVTSLPTSNIDTNKIYLLQAQETEEGNIYTEYAYINSKWEVIGSFKSTVDLTNYTTIEQLNAVEAKIPTKVSQLTNDANYAKKSDIVNEIFILDMTSYVESNITDLADAANNNRAIIMIEITADGISTSHYNVVFNDLQTLMLQKFDNSASGEDVVVKTTSYTFDKSDGTYVKDENKITLYKTGKGNKVLSDDGTYKDWPAVVVTTQELYDEMDIDENTLYIIKE